MVLHRSHRWAAIAAGMAFALPVAAADAHASGPVAQAAGDGAAALTPALVGVPLARTESALSSAADAIDAEKGADAVGPLRASRRYMIRAYNGAKVLIASTPPAPVEEARVRASTARFRKLARRAIRASHAGRIRTFKVRAKASQDEAVGPVFADQATAVFSVMTGQYGAATAAAGMLPDTTGALLTRVTTTLNSAIILRNRLVSVIHNAAPAAPAEEARIAQEADDIATFDAVMPGLVTLIDDEIAQLQALAGDSGTPAAAKTALKAAIAADQQVKTRVNTFWPPVPAED